MSKKMKQKINKEKGQVVLAVLLASALILTLGLSASKVTVTETQIDTDQELLKKAFNTAESGIESYLTSGKTTYTSSDGGQANLDVSNLGGENVKTLSFNSVTLKGDQDYFWLVNHSDDGRVGTTYYSSSASTVSICREGQATRLKVDYFYRDTSNDYKVSRSVIGLTDDGDGNNDCGNFNIGGESLLLVITPVDGDAKISLGGASSFPVQGEEISATGVVNEVNNTVTILDRYDPFLFLMDGIMTKGNITSQ